jgi:MBG domain/IPTL-CTERM motif
VLLCSREFFDFLDWEVRVKRLCGSSWLLLTTLLGLLSFSVTSYSQITMTVRQVGADVVVQASGTADTNSATVNPVTGGVIGGEVDTAGYIYVSSSTAGAVFIPPNFSGPNSIGTGGYHFASTGSGDWFGIWFGTSGVLVPPGYVSGQSLSGTGTYNSTTIATLGLTPGTYTWNWGTGANADSLVLTIEAPTPTATATTNPASSITTTGATLNGTVSANGASTTVIFDYGTTVSYGSTATASQSPLASSASNASVSAALTGLTCNTTYHYRVSATNSVNTTTGSDATFTTSACPAPMLSITNTPQTYTGSPIAAVMTCSSGGAVSNVKYNSSSTVPTNAGTYAVTANCAANGNYSALTDAAAGNFVIATASQTLTVSPTTANVNAGVGQAITLSGAQGTGQVTYNVSNSGSVTCTLSNESNTGVTVTGTSGSGSCSVTASIAADNNYEAGASNTAIVYINLVPQTGFTLNLSSTSVTTNTPVNLSTTGGQGDGNVTYTAEAQGPLPASVQSQNTKARAAGLQCNISGTVLIPTGGTGVCVATAVKAADGNFAAASATVNVTVTAAPLPNSIPTLSEWAQIAMMLMMIATAGWYIRGMRQR